MTSVEMRFFWLPISTIKCSEVPFTHIYEWKRCSPCSGLSGSLGWSLVVETVALGSMSMICLPFSGSSSYLEHTYDLEAITFATNDCFEQQSKVLCQGLLWKSHHFPISFFVFPVSFFTCGLDWLSSYYPSFLCPLFYGLGPPFPGFCCEGFLGPNCCVFCLIFCSILMAYR
jgi:hypothetical protein